MNDRVVRLKDEYGEVCLPRHGVIIKEDAQISRDAVIVLFAEILK